MEHDLLKLEIVTPEGAFLKGYAAMVEFPSDEGELGILPGHIPMLVDLAAGQLRVYRNGGPPERYAIAGGFVQVMPGTVRVVASFASAGEAETDIETACQRARQVMETAETEDPAIIAVELRDLKGELQRLARLQQTKTGN